MTAERICKICHVIKPVTEFRNRDPKSTCRCLECERETWEKTYYVTVNKKRRNLRMEVIEHYGGKCACCGEARFEFLAIDHVNGDGAKHRKETKRCLMTAWLKKNGYPEGFQVLCHNCNMAFGFYGYCPHNNT